MSPEEAKTRALGALDFCLCRPVDVVAHGPALRGLRTFVATAGPLEAARLGGLMGDAPAPKAADHDCYGALVCQGFTAGAVDAAFAAGVDLRSLLDLVVKYGPTVIAAVEALLKLLPQGV